MTIPVRGRIAAFYVNVAHVINSRTGEVVKPVHFVVLRPANEKLSEFQIVGRKMVTDFTMGNLTVGISSFWKIFLIKQFEQFRIQMSSKFREFGVTLTEITEKFVFLDTNNR